jgi:undecaprenyl-diphosphatase
MQIAIWQVVVLGALQGLTEFLPISSSGHLVIAAALLGSADNAPWDVSDVTIVLHVGTLLSILVFYWHRLWRLLGQDLRAVPLLIVATIPAVVVGVPVKLFAESMLESVPLAGAGLIVTGLFLVWGSRTSAGVIEYPRFSLRGAWWVGVTQAAAILPGLSRSGSTIAVGMRQGLAPQSAATFSFLMAVPALAGAGLLEAVSMLTHDKPHTPFLYLAVGAAVSFVVGLFALRWLTQLLERGRFAWFAAWCIPVGVVVLVWQLVVWLAA